jgi:peptide/nickel transport system substrate-binding protein
MTPVGFPRGSLRSSDINITRFTHLFSTGTGLSETAEAKPLIGYRVRRLTAVLMAAPLVLVACSGSGGAAKVSAPSHATVDHRQVKNGGTLTVALSTDPDALDPTTSTTLVGREVFASVCQKLYDINAQSQLVPQLATSLPKMSADGKTATITLRTGVKFNDGTPFDAAAVKKTLDRDRTWNKSARQADVSAVSNVTVVDPSTVRLTLSRPFTPLTAQLADRAGMILSPAQLDKLGNDNFGTHPVCVGPFQFASRTSGSEIVVKRSPYFYDKAAVKLDEIDYKIIVDPNVRAANLKSGDVQVGDNLATTSVASLKADPKVTVESGGGLGYENIEINIANANGSTAKPGRVSTPLAQHPTLRQAFELSLDRDAINKAVYNGLYQPDCSPLPLKSPYRTTTTCSPYDVAKAKSLVAASGVKTPIPVTMLVPDDSTDERLGEVIQSMAKPAGFAVKIRPIDFATELTQAAAGNFDVMLDAWSGRIDPDGNLSNLVTTGGAVNYSGTSDPGVDGPIRQAAAITDVAQRTALYAKAVQRLQQLRGLIYLYHSEYYLGMDKDIAGVGYYADGIPRFITAGYAAGSK